MIEILHVSGKVVAARNFNSMPLIKRLDNTVFAVEFGDQVTIDQAKMYVRARYTLKPSEFVDDDPPTSYSTYFFF